MVDTTVDLSFGEVVEGSYVLSSFGEVVADEQSVCGASGNTCGAWLADTRVSTELGATHAPIRDTGGAWISRWGGS